MDLAAVQVLLNSSDFGDRLRGVNAIRLLPPEVGFECLQAMTLDQNVRVRYAAVCQMATLGTQDLARSESLLLRALADPEIDVQAAAADAIGALNLIQGFDALQALYDSSQEWIVQMSIVAALGEFGDPRAFDLLERALTADNELVRAAAVGALGESGDDRAVALLAPLTHDPDWQLRYRVTQALCHYKNPQALELLTLLAQDADATIAAQAQQAIN